MAEPLIFIVRQQGFDKSHMVVWGAREFLTSNTIPPEWDLARAAFFLTLANIALFTVYCLKYVYSPNR